MIDLSQARSLERTVSATVERGFLDAMGHMNVTWYVHLFDRGIWEYLERHGLDAQYLKREGRGMFALEENLRYLSELREGQPLSVHTGVLEVRPKTLRLLEYMVDERAEKVAAVREVVAVHIDLSTRRSAPFALDVAAALAALPVAASAAGPMTEGAAQEFARRWVDAWNRRDAEAVLAHFAEHAVFVSPKALVFAGASRIEGKRALGAYWQAALARVKYFRFELDEAIWSARSQTLTIRYGATFEDQPTVRAAEILCFEGGRIVRGEALYGAVA
jgi:acyl-CoA thioester hydrolase